jgi:hypothetical protein
VAGAPSRMAPFRFTSVPGHPTFAARRANSGHSTRPEISTLFRAGNIPPLAARESAAGAEAARSLQILRLVITDIVPERRAAHANKRRAAGLPMAFFSAKNASKPVLLNLTAQMSDDNY